MVFIKMIDIKISAKEQINNYIFDKDSILVN